MCVKTTILALMACLSVLVGSGCGALVVGGAVAAGAGTVAWVKGELKATVDGDLDHAWSASQTALKDLQMPVSAEEKDGIQGKLTARAAADKKVTVQVKKATGTTTDIGIRVGTWGDEPMSREILEKIKKHL
jgi:hypothetical protein